jgi:sugar phosphate isomerase/epimerase
MKLSCVTASYVADLLGYPGDVDWGLASRTIESAPMLQTLDGILDRLAPARLDGLEIWYPHASPRNLTPVLASEVRKRLTARDMVCCACAGGVGDPRKDPYGCEEAFQTARLLQASVIAGHLHAGTARRLGEMAARFGVRVAYENGSEEDVTEILSAIEGGNERIGANIDTGNLAARGGDPVQAIRVLGKRVLHVHLKDVPAVGSHQCVAIGTGIVDVQGVFRELKACGYDGWLSIEIETGDHDPTAEILASAETIRRLWRD